MQTLLKYQQEFGGTNRILIALMAKHGDIFTPEFFSALKLATDEVFFIPGVDRSRLRSLLTPNTRYMEIVEEGIAAGNVVPDDFQPTPQGFAKVRQNILKADLLGRLVAKDFSGALISAQLLEIDPNTGESLDYIQVARQLEEKIRERFESESISVDIVGFAKLVGDLYANATQAALFFSLGLLISVLLIHAYSQCLFFTLSLLACSLIAVIWILGLLPLLGYGMDPFAILIPFLVFAIGVSHGLQMIGAVRSEVGAGVDSLTASRRSFRGLLKPGGIALLSDLAGFATIQVIDIEMIQGMAITACLGVSAIMLTHLILLPVIISFAKLDVDYRQRLHQRSSRLLPLWKVIHRVAERKPAGVVVLICSVLLCVGLWLGTGVKVGDQQRGVPELYPHSRYNLDSKLISEKFSIGIDVLTVMLETVPNGCIDHEVMAVLDRFEWFMRSTISVQSVISLAGVAKVINAGWNEGSLKWRVIPRRAAQLAQIIASVPTDSGLLNTDCSVLPVYIFTADHKAQTIDHVTSKVREFQAHQLSASDRNKVRFRLAAGNVGVMAATNEEVVAAQFPILAYVFLSVAVLCLLSFRSPSGVLCIIIPLVLTSLLTYTLMNIESIGLKVNTLPVVALGVSIGVDYGIYIYNRISCLLTEGMRLPRAYLHTLVTSGNGVIFTGMTLAASVAVWICSPLKFQADMGFLLSFMFLLNMLGAILLLPALLARLSAKV